MKTKKVFRNSIVICLSVILLISSSISAVAAPKNKPEEKVVRVGYYSEAGMMNGVGDGEPKSGYVYEYMQEIASEAGWKYEYVYDSFSNLYKKLLAGEIDLLPYITWTEARTHEVLFPDMKMGDEQFYIASLNRGRLSDSLKELQGKKVGTTRDAFQNIPFRELTEEKNIDCELVEFKGPDEKWVALANGEIDYCIETDTIFQSIELHAVYEFGERYPYYMIVNMDRKDLLEDLNRAQKQLNEVDPGYLDNLKYKYFKGIPIYKELPDESLEWLETHDVIRIGTFDKDEPYVIENKDGTITGIAPDYMRIMMDAFGIDIPFEWKLYGSTQEGLEALRAGEIDLFNPYYRNYNEAETDGVIISKPVYDSDMSILYEGAYTDNTLSVIATPGTRLGANYIKDNYPNKEILKCDDGYDCIEKLQNGEATCVIMYTDALYEISKKYNKNYSIKSLNAHCPVSFAALPENSALISIINKSASFVTDVDMNEIQNRHSAENSTDTSVVDFFRKHPEYIVGSLAVLFAIALLAVIYKSRKDKAFLLKQKEADFYKGVIEQFTSAYDAVILGNIKEDSYRIIVQNEEVKGLFTGQDSLSDVSKKFIDRSVYYLDKDKVESLMIGYEEVKEKLPIGTSDTLEYRGNAKEGYLWYRTTLNRISEDEIIIGFRECDDEIVSNMITDKLMEDYDAIYMVDLDRKEIRPVRPSKVSRIGDFTERRDYFSTVIQFAQTVGPQYKDDWADFSSIDFIKEYMAEDDYREYVYELPGTEKTMRRFTINVLERIDGRPVTLLYSFMGIDDYRAQTIALHKQMADQKVLLDYFVDSYDSAFFVDLYEDTITVLHMNTEFSSSFGEYGEDWDAMQEFIDEHIHPDDRLQMRQYIDKVYVKNRLREEPSFTFTVREIFNNAEKTMRGLVVRGTDEDHIALGFMNITEEIRERREAERRLQEALAMAQSANRAKTTFLNSMSHDIRTPMNAIIGFTNLATGHIDNKAQVQDYLKKIGQSSEHLLSLINDVLDMSRIESGKLHLDEKPENLGDIILALRDIVQVDINSKHHDFLIDMVNVNNQEIVCDKLRLNQVLLNILSNSIKYTPQGGTISMRITEKDGRLSGYAKYIFIIKDNGMGMDEDYLKTIYDPFTRVNSSTVSGIQGTGLGMAITKNIIDMMGGDIDIKSEPGRGTEIQISLEFKLQDIIKDSIQPEQAVEEDKVSGERFVGKKLLLVEDNELNREIATEILEEYGFVIDTAEDGNIAVDIIRDAKVGDYDAVLMDIQMPTMDGYEATRQIRAFDSDVSKIPIIAMTANAFEEDRKAALEAGMNEHIAKPVDVNVLIEILSKFL